MRRFFEEFGNTKKPSQSESNSNDKVDSAITLTEDTDWKVRTNWNEKTLNSNKRRPQINPQNRGYTFVAHLFSWVEPSPASRLIQSPAQVVAPSYVHSTALYLHTEVEIKKGSEVIKYSKQKVFNNTGDDCVRRVFWIEIGRRTLPIIHKKTNAFKKKNAEKL